MSTLDTWKTKLDELGTKVGEANNLVSQYQSAAYSVPDLAKKRMSEMYNNNKDLIDQESQAQFELNTTPTNYAAEMQTGRFASNPILAGQAAAQREATIERKLTSIRGIRQERMGTIKDNIDAATNAFGAEVSAREGAAKQVSDQYQMASEGYNRAMDEEKFAESKRQFNAQEGRLWAAQNAKEEYNPKDYSFKEQKDDLGTVTGINFYGANDQPVSAGKYFAGINKGSLDLTQMANLFKTSANEGDKQIAAEIISGVKGNMSQADIANSLNNKYPWLFAGLE